VAFFGNLTRNIQVNTDTVGCVFKNLVLNAGVTLTTTTAVTLTGLMDNTIFASCTFGATQAHTNDIVVSALAIKAVFHNCLFNGATVISGQSSMLMGSVVSSQKHNQTVNNHLAWKATGTATTDTTIFDSVSPSSRLTPTSASFKLETSGFWSTAVASGATVTPTVRVRKSVVGDGTAYNGNQPRLILLANPAAGIPVDVVLATASGAAGSWETLSGTTAAVTDNAILQFAVDCDGTTGWVNVDNVTLVSADTSGLKYWQNGGSTVLGVPSGSGGAFTFVG
jgi:hypothetical protein